MKVKEKQESLNFTRLMIYIYIVSFLYIIPIHAQNDILLTQQWLSRINQNPAATGNSDNIGIFILTHKQLAGFEDTPSTQVLISLTIFIESAQV